MMNKILLLYTFVYVYQMQKKNSVSSRPMVDAILDLRHDGFREPCKYQSSMALGLLC